MLDIIFLSALSMNLLTLAVKAGYFKYIFLLSKVTENYKLFFSRAFSVPKFNTRLVLKLVLKSQTSAFGLVLHPLIIFYAISKKKTSPTMSAPNQETLDSLLLESQRIIREEATCDSSYKNEWRNFKKYVDERDGLGPDADGKYLSGLNVEFYFIEKQIHRTVQQNQMMRVVWALEWYANHREHISKAYNVRTPAVMQVVRAQQARMKNGAGAKPGNDPNKGKRYFLFFTVLYYCLSTLFTIIILEYSSTNFFFIFYCTCCTNNF